MNSSHLYIPGRHLEANTTFVMCPVVGVVSLPRTRSDSETLLFRAQRVPPHSGIGKRTAYNLARMGAKVVMACRSLERGEKARQELEEEMRFVSG